MEKIEKKHIEATRYFLEQNQYGLSKTKVAKMFNSDRHAMLRYEKLYDKVVISKKDPDDGYYYYFTEDEKRLVQKYVNSKKPKAVFLRENGSPIAQPTLNRWLPILGYQDTRHYKVDFNRSVFSSIKDNDYEKAYWLGFLLADGSVGRSLAVKGSSERLPATISLGLAERDKNHLYKFARFMGVPEDRISSLIKTRTGGAKTRDNPCVFITFSSKNMLKDLANYGILPHKSMIEQPYIFKNKQMQMNYVRGVIDGDGWVSVKKKSFGLCGSKDVCLYVLNFLKTLSPCEIKAECTHRKEISSGELYSFSIVKKQAVSDMLKSLYLENSCVYLDRKYNNAMAVCKSLN